MSKASRTPSAGAAPTARETIRIDKWLWHARQFKTRGLAAEFVEVGRVRVDGQPVSKPGRSVGAGNVLTFAVAGQVRVLRILACGQRRGPAPEARLLYEDLSDPEPEQTSAGTPKTGT